WPGGHLPFFASPKKGKPKKGDRRLALRVMAQASSHFVRYKKWETDETRLRLRQRLFLIHFL
ncbi:hypothetical protein, partial [Undibacterium sp.]|uniref:hypothetical protein n=1 Tax=Undibacterium sp. TaxID=1914977 RepID=UPI002B5989DA